jgi:cell division protein FtsN
VAAASAPKGAPAHPKAAENKPAVTGGDPLGDLARAKAAAAPAPAAAGADPFLYFIQAGAFRTSEDAEAQRAKLSLIGLEAKVTEREQSGRTVYRVRIGPFERKEEADKQKERLEAGGVETALVRQQR